MISLNGLPVPTAHQYLSMIQNPGVQIAAHLGEKLYNSILSKTNLLT